MARDVLRGKAVLIQAAISVAPVWPELCTECKQHRRAGGLISHEGHPRLHLVPAGTPLLQTVGALDLGGSSLEVTFLPPAGAAISNTADKGASTRRQQCYQHWHACSGCQQGSTWSPAELVISTSDTALQLVPLENRYPVCHPLLAALP